MNLTQHGALLVEEAIHDPESLSLANSSEVVTALVEHLDCHQPLYVARTQRAQAIRALSSCS